MSRQILEVSGRRYYTQLVNFYSEAKSVPIAKDCTKYFVTNVGDTNATINQIPLYPGVPGTSLGDSVAIGANELDIYSGNLDISFTTPVGAAPRIMIVQIVYLKDER